MRRIRTIYEVIKLQITFSIPLPATVPKSAPPGVVRVRHGSNDSVFASSGEKLLSPTPSSGEPKTSGRYKHLLFLESFLKKRLAICDAIKQNESELEKEKKNLFFYVQCMPQPQSYSTLKTHKNKHTVPEMAQNNKVQRKLNAVICCISKSIIASSDSFCLTTSHMLCDQAQ